MYEIIDAHCHIYPDKIADKAVQGIGNFYEMGMAYDGRLETLQRVNREAGVTHSIIFSVATTPHQVSSINHFIAENADNSGGTMTGLGALHPDSEDPEGDVRQILELGLKGVKLHPDVQKFAMDDARCMRLYELCEGRLPILFHCGDTRYDFSNPNRLKRVLENFPRLQVIGAHFGGWSLWEEAARELCGYPNLVVDCSSAFPYLAPETAKRIIGLYSPERVLYASDFPMWHPKDNIEYLERLGLRDEDYENIFSKNARRVFGM